MTSNESINQMKELLDNEDRKDSNIHINYDIQGSVEFLDVFIENIQGKLRTSVFRKSAVEPYILPYTSNRRHHIHSNKFIQYYFVQFVYIQMWIHLIKNDSTLT